MTERPQDSPSAASLEHQKTHRFLETLRALGRGLPHTHDQPRPCISYRIDAIAPMACDYCGGTLFEVYPDTGQYEAWAKCAACGSWAVAYCE